MTGRVSVNCYYMWPFHRLNLLKCMGKLRRDHEEDVILPKRHCQHQGSAQEHPLVPLAKLLSHIQVSQLRTTRPDCTCLHSSCKDYETFYSLYCIYPTIVFRLWKRTWGMFLLYTWTLLWNWRARVNSCWSGWASSAELSRVVTPRVCYYSLFSLQYVTQVSSLGVLVDLEPGQCVDFP